MILMREINDLSAKLLNRIYRQSRHHQVRQRAHCLLLINQGQKKVKELMETFDVSYRTIYNWIHNWDSEGMVGLYKSLEEVASKPLVLNKKNKFKPGLKKTQDNGKKLWLKSKKNGELKQVLKLFKEL